MKTCHSTTKTSKMSDQVKRLSYCASIPIPTSNVVIEEGDTDFKMRCLIMKSEKRADDDEEAEQANDEQSEQPTETVTEPQMTPGV